MKDYPVDQAGGAREGAPDPPMQVAAAQARKKWPQRKRKDVTCAKCGKVFSSNTRRHKCVSLKENEMSPPRETPPEGCSFVAPKRARPYTTDIKSVAEMSPRAPPPLTMDMVRTFLTEERSRYRSAQRDAWVGSLF